MRGAGIQCAGGGVALERSTDRPSVGTGQKAGERHEVGRKGMSVHDHLQCVF